MTSEEKKIAKSQEDRKFESPKAVNENNSHEQSINETKTTNPRLNESVGQEASLPDLLSRQAGGIQKSEIG